MPITELDVCLCVCVCVCVEVLPDPSMAVAYGTLMIHHPADTETKCPRIQYLFIKGGGSFTADTVLSL